MFAASMSVVPPIVHTLTSTPEGSLTMLCEKCVEGIGEGSAGANIDGDDLMEDVGSSHEIDP